MPLPSWTSTASGSSKSFLYHFGYFLPSSVLGFVSWFGKVLVTQKLAWSTSVGPLRLQSGNYKQMDQ